MKIGRTLIYLVIVVLLSGAMSTYFSYKYLQSWGKTALIVVKPVDVRVPRGVSLKQLSKIFEQQKVVSNAFLFENWVRFFSNFRQFQAGRYLFQGNLSPERIAKIVIAGEIYQPVVYSVTIPEGFTMQQIADRLIADEITSADAFEKIKQDKRLLAALKVPSESFEGYLYPATYNFITRPDARVALKEMVRTFWKELPLNYEQRIQKKDISLHEAVTIASLIERETGRDDERSSVSEVIWNRLTRKIPLAIDASIIYGIRDFDGNLKRKDLKDKSNPYNTRVYAGLPPTPICSPSKASLKAVLNPTNEGYYYYVVEDIDTRKHHFSKTLKEHNKYVRKLINQERLRR